MKKLVKFCLVLFLFFGMVPLNVHAQSDSVKIVINDLIGEARLTEKTKQLIKVSLTDNSTGTVHQVLYYLTPNTFDVSISQIKDELVAQKIELNLENMENAQVDTEAQKYQTNLGELTQKLISVKIPLTNPSEVAVVPESETEQLTVRELPESSASPNGEVIEIVTFKDENDKVLHREYFLVYYDDNNDLLKMATDKFNEKYPEYTVDGTKATQTKPISTEMETFSTDKGEIKAFSMEVIVPVQQKGMTSSESMSTLSTSEEMTQSSMSEMTSESQSEMSTSQQSVNVEKSEASKESKESSVSTKTTKQNLPSTGENNSIITTIVAGIVLLLGVLLIAKPLISKMKK